MKGSQLGLSVGQFFDLFDNVAANVIIRRAARENQHADEGHRQNHHDSAQYPALPSSLCDGLGHGWLVRTRGGCIHRFERNLQARFRFVKPGPGAIVHALFDEQLMYLIGQIR